MIQYVLKYKDMCTNWLIASKNNEKSEEEEMMKLISIISVPYTYVTIKSEKE